MCMRESTGMPGSSVPGACLWRAWVSDAGGGAPRAGGGRQDLAGPPARVVLLRHLASDVGRSTPASPRPRSRSCPAHSRRAVWGSRGSRPSPRSSACRPGGIPARPARPPAEPAFQRFLGVGGGGTRPGLTPTMSGRSGRAEAKAVSGGGGGGRDRVSVQEGPSGGREAGGSGPRRRGRRPCRRLRNQAGQFVSVVTVFEAQGTPSGGQDASGPSTRRRGRPPRKHRRKKVAIATEVTLFEMVALGKNSVQQTAVEEWVRSYKEDRELALLDLISFFVQCCGCEGMVTAELYQSNEGQNVLHRMTEKFDQETGLYYKKFLAYPWILTIMWPEKLQSDFYPIVGPGPFWKRFRVNFCEFTELLVHQTHSSVLCDGHLMDTVIGMLSGLTNSAVYSLRHTSSLAAMKLLTALASVNQGICTGRRTAQRLYEIESITKLKGRHKYYMELLDQRRHQFQNKPVAIDNIICALFKRTFVPRYRDISSDIRVICMGELGCWVRLYPDLFLDNNYLKYIGWMLYDKDASVRMKCILALKALYEKRESAMKLGLFFYKFKKRILSMTQDRQPEITSECMQLLRLISEHYVGVFSAMEYVFLFQFVYAAYRPMATAAGELICKRLLAPPPHEGFFAQEPPDEFDRNLQNMKALIDFYLQGEFHRHVPYLVDGLWEAAPALVRNWECMTALLLEPRGGRQALTSQQERVLIEILVAAVRQAAEGRPPAGRRLGKKFAADKEKVTPLLQIPQYCNLDVYDTDGLGSYLDAALLELDCLVQRHSDVAVLEACARAYGTYCDEGRSAHGQAAPACSRLVDMLVDALTPLLDVFIQHEKQGLFLGHGEMGRICSTLRRLAAFYSAHDLSSWNLYEKMDSLLTFRRHQGSLPTEVVHCALQCTYYALLWQIVAATDRLPPQEALLDLRKRLLRFCLVCRVYLNHQSKVLSEKAFILLCDLLLILSHQGPEEDTGLGLLFFVPDHVLQCKLLTFVKEHVFLEEAGAAGPSRVYKEEDADELHELFHRRNMLAVFCKLIVCNVLEMSAAADIYQFYLKHYHHFGDIIKETMTRTRQNDRLRNALSLLLCLQQLFQKHVDTYGMGYDPIEFICGPFYSIRLLARRFALTLGFDRARDAAHLIHRRGLAFAFSESPVSEEEEARQRFPNLSFLLVLAEFSCKIPPAERQAALTHFQDSIPEGLPVFGEGDMNPMLVYRKSLIRTNYVAQGEDEPAANPFDAICKDSKRPQELPVGTCSTWTPDTLASCSAGDREPRNSSKGQKSKRDVFDVDFLSSEDSENSSSEDVDVEGISVHEPCVDSPVPAMDTWGQGP
ncbi:cohesin subunit SA-2-like isoform X3 [Mustela erminea]|uniref:cohesin subunit SA-2-like isoform X3 n=1 Tax=Mustela erminea TaxID=36723 RepID=UPI001386E6C0|nr:cohesin subunit SA-2-like isoform X3 [Mustela erminea]